MRVAALSRQREHLSLCIYYEHIKHELTALGVKVVSFPEAGPVSTKCDLVWDPGLSGNRAPRKIFKNTHKPVVATVHGAAHFTMKWLELFPNSLIPFREILQNLRALSAWRWFRDKVSAVITVSEFGAQEVSHVFALPRSKMYAIYHGIDHNTFQINGEMPGRRKCSYFLQVAQHQPKKNVERVFAAYALLPESHRPDLMAILPGYHGDVDMKGIKIIREALPSLELAKWYRGALGFVFPSLHETFGMPILEAMACGCPVITSNNTACAEIAGDAALLVNPRSVDDIVDAMRRIIEDEGFRQSLREKGLAQAQQFTWRKSAEKHLKVFEAVLSEKHER